MFKTPVHRYRTWLFSSIPRLALLLTGLITTSCIQAAPDVVRIGLVAPFEGRYREIGNEIIPAARLAIREYAQQHEQASIVIELVAYDDSGDPQQAAEQARKLVVDPEVAVIIGHWRAATTQAARPIYVQAGLPLITFSTEDLGASDGVYNLAPSEFQLKEAAGSWLTTQHVEGSIRLEPQSDVTTSIEQLRNGGRPAGGVLIGGPDWGLLQFHALSDQAAEGVYFVTGAAEPGNRYDAYWTDERTLQFVAGFEEGSLNAPPGLLSMTAYEATWLAISLATGTQLEASPLRTASFNQGRRLNAPINLYQWENGERKFIEQLR